MIAAHYAGWYGTGRSGLFLFPFAAMLGGIALFTVLLTLAESFGHQVLGVGKTRRSAETQIPATAEPGVARGQEAMVLRPESSPSRL